MVRTRRGEGLSGRLAGLAAAVAAVIAGVLVLSAVHLLPQLRNPFAETTTDRSQPVLLKSITALSRYEAASGSFQGVVDLSRRMASPPSLIAGSDPLFGPPRPPPPSPPLSPPHPNAIPPSPNPPPLP